MKPPPRPAPVADVMSKARAELDAVNDPAPVDRGNVTRDIPSAVEVRPRVNTAYRVFQEKMAARRKKLGLVGPNDPQPEPVVEEPASG